MVVSPCTLTRACVHDKQDPCDWDTSKKMCACGTPAKRCVRVGYQHQPAPEVVSGGWLSVSAHQPHGGGVQPICAACQPIGRTVAVQPICAGCQPISHVVGVQPIRAACQPISCMVGVQPIRAACQPISRMVGVQPICAACQPISHMVGVQPICAACQPISHMVGVQPIRAACQPSSHKVAECQLFFHEVNCTAM